MEKIRITFSILIVWETLLMVPTFAKGQLNHTDVYNTTTPGSVPNHIITTTLVNMNKTNNISTTVESVASSTSPPSKEEPKKTEFKTTTNKIKAVITPGPGIATRTETTVTTRTTSTSAVSEAHKGSSEKTVYIIVIIFIILSVVIIVIIFFCVKRRRRRFSVDIHTKHEDAEVPLALVEPEICESTPKDLETFTSAKECSPTDNMENGKDDKAPTEADQQAKENAGVSQTTESPVENPAKPADLDINDCDPTASTKTSVETLNDVLNENNSNNNAVNDAIVHFIDIALND